MSGPLTSITERTLAVVPFWGSDSHRVRNFQLVVAHLRAGGLAVACSGKQPPPAARNAGARHPFLQRELLLFVDADSLVPHDQMIEGLELAEREPGLVFCFDVYQRLSRGQTARIGDAAAAFAAPVEWESFRSASSGCVAVSRAFFDEVGGYDETWTDGFEDYDFAERCNMLAPVRRVEGPLVHLWHPRPTVEPEHGEGRDRYLATYGKEPAHA